MSFKYFLTAICLCLLLASSALADVPQMINYQGKITTPQGALIDTTISMTFAIYTDSIGSDSLWSETQSSVVVEKGIFSVLLGSVIPIPDSVFTGETKYLGVKAGDDPEMSPRKAIVSVAYAYTDGDWILSGSNVYRSYGNVGIGTDNPLTSLYVYKDTNEFVGLSIENPNTDPNSSEGIYFWNEDIGVAGIRLFDEDHASYAGRMNIFNNRPVGSIHFGTAGQLSRMTIANDGNVGIGTAAPDGKLVISGMGANLALKIEGSGSNSYFHNDAAGLHIKSYNDSNLRAIKFHTGSDWTPEMVIQNNGNVGIGTAYPAYKLDVEGDINVAGSYNVKKGGVNYTHPDYVFEANYNLMSLNELKEYVFENKTLPNVISTEDVKKNEGFKMDELLIQMLEKIEEQTLYIFQLEERITELERGK